jgi:hypothetical protein
MNLNTKCLSLTVVLVSLSCSKPAEKSTDLEPSDQYMPPKILALDGDGSSDSTTNARVEKRPIICETISLSLEPISKESASVYTTATVLAMICPS